MSTIAADPAEVHAAVTDLFEGLRALVDRGPTDDPALLDELAALTRRARGRITRANKRAQQTAEKQTAEKPAAASNTQAKQNAPGQAEPRKAPLQPADTKQPAQKTAPAAAKPAAQRVIMSLARRPATRPAGTATPRRASDAHPRWPDARPQPGRLLFWALVAVGALAVVAGVSALAVISPWLLVPVSGALGVLAQRLRRVPHRAAGHRAGTR